MRRPGWGSLLLALALVLPGLALSAPVPDAPPSAASGPVAGIVARAGDHPGFGRLVFDFPHPVGLRVTHEGTEVVLKFGDPVPILAPGRNPRNVTSVSGGAGAAVVRILPGATGRDYHIGGRVVLDVFDPAAAAPGEDTKPPPLAAAETTHAAMPRPAAGRPGDEAGTAIGPAATGGKPKLAARPLPALPERVAAGPGTAAETATSGPPADVAPGGDAPGQPAAGRPAPSPPVPASPAPAASGPGAAPQSSPPPAPPNTLAQGPLALAAEPVGTAEGNTGAAFSLPFGKGVGAAALRRGDAALVVFDEPRPVDLAALRAMPAFAGAVAQVLPMATVIRVPLPAPGGLALARDGRGWTVTRLDTAVQPRPIQPAAGKDALLLAAAGAGRSLTIADPETGATLLVGTLLAPGLGVVVERRNPAYVLLPTWQGVVVEAQSDRVALRAVAEGFAVSLSDPAEPPLAAGLPLLDDAGIAGIDALTRSFDLPALSQGAWNRHMQAGLAAAASNPPLARTASRVETARAMIALGLGPEAQAMMRLAAADDPATQDDPGFAAQAAQAALLAGRGEEAGGIDDPGLPLTDELAFWRALRLAQSQEASPAAAAVFAATGGVLLRYPPTLRDKLAPLVLETMALGGEPKAAMRLMSGLPDAPDLALVRAMLREQAGDVDGALAGYDALQNGHDRLARIRAGRRAAELRLSSGRVNDAGAADALEKLLFAWRGDERELALRLRVAELRERAGQWRQALALLRETEAAWPDQAADLHKRLTGAFTALLQSDATDRLSPIDLVALIEENADLMPQGAEGDVLAARLADRLVALDLPRRAAPVLEKLMRAAPPGAARAAFGLRLGEVRLAAGDPEAALRALIDSGIGAAPGEAPAGVTQAIAERRTILFARLAAARGDPARAAAALGALGTPAADAARASILEQARDWPGAEAALSELAARSVPAEGKLDDAQQRLLLRLAGATAQAGDAAAWAALARREGPRMQGGPFGDMFRLLTADPVAGVGDLPRAAREMALARGVPDALAAIAPNPPAPPR